MARDFASLCRCRRHPQHSREPAGRIELATKLAKPYC